MSQGGSENARLDRNPGSLAGKMASERAALRKAVCLPGGRRPTCYAFCPLALLGRRRSPLFWGTGDTYRKQRGSAVAGPHFFSGPATLFANGEALPSQVPTFFRDRRHLSQTERLCRRRSRSFGYYVGCRNLRRAWFGCKMGLFAPKRPKLRQTGEKRAFLHPNVCGVVAEGRGFAPFKNVCYLRVPCHRG